MDMMGLDHTFNVLDDASGVDAVLRAVRWHWPEAVLKQMGEAEPIAVREACNRMRSPFPAAAGEFFLFRDEASSVAWQEHGWTKTTAGSLLHVIIGASDGGMVCVIEEFDDDNDEIEGILSSVNDRIADQWELSHIFPTQVAA